MVRPVVRRFDIEVGHCSQCQRRVQGRHVLQTSDALGAAGVQLGPGVVALVVELHTEMGVPLAVSSGTGSAKKRHRRTAPAVSASERLAPLVGRARKVTATRSRRRARGAVRFEPARMGGPPVAVRDHQRPSAPEV